MLSFGIGIVYLVLGIVLLIQIIGSEDIFINNARDTVLSFELIILGGYALLHAFIFCFLKADLKEKRILIAIRESCICLMFPYHLGIKALCHKYRKTIIEYDDK